MNEEKTLHSVRRWLESFVIELNLCPFAKRELVKERVRFSVTEADSPEQLLSDLLEEFRLLEDDSEIETTLLIHPNVLQEFEDYNQFLDLVDALIDQQSLNGIFQVASFHPRYQFADTDSEDVENYSNRSPYPLLHILREASVERQVQNYPDIGDVPRRNIELLRSLGGDKLRAMLRSEQ